MASKRNYLSQEELAEFADITITDAGVADVKISQAEEMIDAFVGPQEKFMREVVMGRASSAAANTITLQSDQISTYETDYFKYCYIEIIGGVGAGQTRTITGNAVGGVLTVQDSWTTTPDSTSFYRITQLAKFPRAKDVVYYNTQLPATYYKSIPDEVKRAVAAQVQFIIEMGDSYFSGNKADLQSEHIGDYIYTKLTTGALYKIISPKAKLLLKGMFRRSGSIDLL